MGADPASILIGTLALGGASSAMGALGARREGQEAAAAANANASAEEINAAVARKEAGLREQQQRAQTRRILSRGRALQGASGLAMSGSFLDVAAANAEQGELDALTLRYGGQIEEARSKSQARLDRARGKHARQAGNLNAFTSILGGASRLSSGYTSAKGYD
jgi:hypothetical protein